VKPKITRRRKKNPKILGLQVPKDATLTCDLCGENFSGKSKIRAHMREEHRPPAYKSCHICGKFYKPRYLEIHLQIHAGTLVGCGVCGKQMKPQSLMNHMAYVHRTDEPFGCEVCGKMFKSKRNLHDHMKIHERRYQCDMCGRHFALNTQLQDHRLSHINPETFACKICAKVLCDKKGLAQHMNNIHPADGVRVKKEKKEAKQLEKVFQCTLCDYSSVCKGNLKKHCQRHEKNEMKSRMNPNGLKCTICCGTFNTDLSLTTHYRKVHYAENMKCEHCESVLKTKMGYWAHLRKVHNIEPEKRPKKAKVVRKRMNKPKGEGRRRRVKGDGPKRNRRVRNSEGVLVDRVKS
jgi:KRAB domain-containing zinc finger protein